MKIIVIENVIKITIRWCMILKDRIIFKKS